MEQVPQAVVVDSDHRAQASLWGQAAGRNLMRSKGRCPSSKTSEEQIGVHRDVYNFVGEQGCEKLGEIMLHSLTLHHEVEGNVFC